MNERKGTWIEHLNELRRRIIWIGIFVVISFFIGFFIAQPVIQYLKSVEPASNITWNVFSPWDSIRIYVNVAFIFAIVVSLPFILYQIWAFVKPGLRAEEKRVSLIYIPLAFLLCICGLAFGYFVVFPLAFFFTTFITHSLELTETYGISQYFSFMFNILLPLTVLFELPVVVMFLVKLRIITPKLLTKFRRHAYLLLLIIGAVITPPDLISALVVTIPMIILYEFSIALATMVYRKQQKEDQLREAKLET